MARRLDPQTDAAIHRATLELLAKRGFAAMTIEAVAAAASVGKPAIYRRYPEKASLVAATIERQLPQVEVPNVGDTRAELWLAVERGFPEDGPSYVRLVGSLIAVEDQHPELIAALRERLILPRRALAAKLIERGQRRGQIRFGIDPGTAVDSLVGPFLARVFAGLDTGPDWRRKAFDTWWQSVAPPS